MRIFHKIALALVAIMLTGLSAMAEDIKVGDLYFTLNTEAKTATLARNTEYKTLTAVTVPGKINVENIEYTVTAVAQQAFQDCTSLVSLSFEPGVREIGKWAFYRCSGIKTLALPSTLETVMASGFSKCTGIEELILPDGLTNIENFGFGTLSSLRKLTLPARMKEIGNSAFSDCSSLKELNINSGINTIKSSAFYKSGLETLEIPSNVETIDGAFSNNKQLKTVTGCEGLTTVGEGAFFECDALESISLPARLHTIGNNAFYNCKALKGVTIPANVFVIGGFAFYGCSSLTEAVWPQNVKTMEKATFYECSSLKTISLPMDMTSIGEMAFQGCTSLESIELPTELEAISRALFNHCSSLKQVTVPAKVTSIGEYAFAETAIEQLDIPAGVTELGENITTECGNLLRYKVAAGNPNYADVDGVLTNKAKTVILQYPGGRKGDYTVPEGVERIDGYVFRGNTALTGITFPKSLKQIGPSAFMSATGLTRIVLPEALESIGGTCFFFASNIKEIILPNTNLAMGTNAFSATGVSRMIFPETIARIGIEGEERFSIMTMNSNLEWVSLPSSLVQFSPLGINCSKLTTIYSFAVNPAEISGENAVDGAITVKVPKGSANAYKTAWGMLYPNATFEDALPTGASVNMTGDNASLSWEPYGDERLAAPARYKLILRQGETVVSAIELSGAQAQGKTLSHVWNNLEKKVYSYELQGFQTTGEMSLRYTGDFDMAQSGIDGIVDDSATAPAEYYDLFGRKVTDPAKGQVVIRRQGNKAEKIVFE